MDSLTSLRSSSSAGALLAPGFRFHPTDEELVSYYLKRKIYGKSFRVDAIAEVDVYKLEPWDLPGKSKLKSRDLEWYFFSVLDKKYGNGARTNRATEKGYWKTTGKDRAVSHKSQIVGMKKTLVYHSGRAPRGQRTNWVMHEYKLMDEALAKAGIFQDAFVLCRIFQKSGPGPKNGEKYGAPLVEEEWEDDELVLALDKENDELVLAVDKEEVEEAVVSDDSDIYLDSNDLQQIFDAKIPVEAIPLPLSLNYGENGIQVQEMPVEESYHAREQEPENPHSSSVQIEKQMDVKPGNQELFGETSNCVSDLDFLLDEQFFDAMANDSFDDMALLETDDLLNPPSADPSGVDMLEEYLNFFNPDHYSNPQDLTFDSSNVVGNENLFADKSFFNPEFVNGEARQQIMGNQQLLQGFNDDDHLMLKQKHENVESGDQYSFIQKASYMLGGISAPPALASEFPTKESVLRLASTSNSSVHLSAGMIQTQKLRSDQGKNVDFSFILSLRLSHNNADNSLNFKPSVSDVLTKATSAVSRSVMYLVFFWVLILSVTYKLGSCFCSGNVSS